MCVAGYWSWYYICLLLITSSGCISLSFYTWLVLQFYRGRLCRLGPYNNASWLLWLFVCLRLRLLHFTGSYNSNQVNVFILTSFRDYSFCTCRSSLTERRSCLIFFDWLLKPNFSFSIRLFHRSLWRPPRLDVRNLLIDVLHCLFLDRFFLHLYCVRIRFYSWGSIVDNYFRILNDWSIVDSGATLCSIWLTWHNDIIFIVVIKTNFFWDFIIIIFKNYLLLWLLWGWRGCGKPYRLRFWDQSFLYENVGYNCLLLSHLLRFGHWLSFLFRRFNLMNLKLWTFTYALVHAEIIRLFESIIKVILLLYRCLLSKLDLLWLRVN